MAQFCTFYLDEKIFGLDILAIQEIIRLQDITPVPNSPSFVEGLTNLRGQIVVAVNLRKLFELSPPPAFLEPVNIILYSNGEAMSLLADRAGDVHDFGKETMVTPPTLQKGPGTRLIKGVFQLKDSLLHVMDAKAIFEIRNATDSNHLSQAI